MAIELTVGTNTYASLDEANTFFESRPFDQFWILLDDEDKKKYLILAYDTLSRIRLQTDLIYTEDEEDGLTLDDEWMKKAQCYEALALYFVYSDEEMQTRLSLQLQGVTKFQFNKQIEEYKGKRPTIAGLFSHDAYLEIKGYVFRYPTKVQHSI